MNANPRPWSKLLGAVDEYLNSLPYRRLYGEDGGSIVAFFALIWRGRWFVLGVTALAGLIGLYVALTATPLYRSSFSLFVKGAPQRSSTLGQLAGISSTLGLDLGDESLAVDIHELASSRRVRREILARTWKLADGRRTSLFTYWGLVENSPADSAGFREVPPEAFASAMDRLRLVVTVATRPTELIIIAVDLGDPVLAADIAGFLGDYLRDQYTEIQQRNARAERDFIASRLEATSAELQEAETALTNFIRNNQSFKQSPSLTQQYTALQREVEVLSQVYLTLRPQYEMAKIEEVRRLPLIEILDPPEVPVAPFQPERSTIVVGAGILGVLLGIVLLLALAYTRYVRDDLNNGV